MFTTHGGKYWTRSYGPNRRESTIAKEVRFERQKWDVRAQVALGLVHAYYAFDTMEAYDFLAGIFTFDPKMDDETLDPTAVRQPARQLGRGLSNVFLGLSEIPQCMIETTRQQGDYAGATTGFAQGVWRCVLREGVGVMEVVTFPMGWDPIIEPEYPALPTRSSDWQVNRPQFRERL
jgi:putative exosortase-associated protein (TIGR04073 family)